MQNLKVILSRFSGIHGDGILAYTTLQELYLHCGSIDGSYPSDDNTVEFGRCCDGSFRCPDLSPLEFLRVLHMNVSGLLDDEPIDWVCLYCLLSLQALTLHSTTQDLKIDQNLTMLGNLTSLKLIGAASPYTCGIAVSVAMNVSWGAMPSLQNIDVESDRLQLGPKGARNASGIRSQACDLSKYQLRDCKATCKSCSFGAGSDGATPWSDAYSEW